MNEHELELLPGVIPQPMPQDVYKDFLEDYRSQVPAMLEYWDACRARSKHPHGILPPFG